MRTDLGKIVAIVVLAGLSSLASAQGVTVAAGTTIESILVAQQGKKVTLKLGPNDELSGTVKVVTKDVVLLSELTGREFFDAVVDIKSVKAVIVRARN
jgi:phytoene dehydrogenase-like protein